MIYIKREENYFGRCTPIVEWIVMNGDKILHTFTTRREAREYIQDFYPTVNQQGEFK